MSAKMIIKYQYPLSIVVIMKCIYIFFLLNIAITIIQNLWEKFLIYDLACVKETNSIKHLFEK